MPWIKDIADNVVKLVLCVPVKVRIFYVGLIIVLGFGLLYFMEIHDYQIHMAQFEKSNAQPSPNNKSIKIPKGSAGGIYVDDNKITARSTR